MAIAAAALAPLALPAAASASTLTVDATASTLTYSAGSGEANQIAVTAWGNEIRFQDRGVAEVPLIETGASTCVIQEPWKVRCPAAEVTSAKVDLGDGTDSFDGSLSAVPMTILAGSGTKTITTGAGADHVFVRNGVADTVACGDGDDTVVADPADTVASDCEHVDRGDGGSDGSGATTTPTETSTPTPAGGGGTQPRGNVFQTPIGLTLPSGVAVPRANRAIVALTCALTTVTGCRGEVVLQLPGGQPGHGRVTAGHGRVTAGHGRVTAARGHFLAQQRSSRVRRIGRRRFKLAPGQSAKLPVRIALRGHYIQLRRRHRLRGVLKVVERDPTGKVLDVESRTITLKAPSREGSRAR